MLLLPSYRHFPTLHWRNTEHECGMTYPITYDYPAKTFARIVLMGTLTTLGAVAVIYNILSNPLDNVGGTVLSLAMMTFGSGMLWGMMRPQQIRLSETMLHLPKTILSGNGKDILYEDIIGVSLVLHQWGQSAIIMSVNHKMSVTTHFIGRRNFYDLIDQIHAHAPHLGPPPMGTLRGVFNAGRLGLPG